MLGTLRTEESDGRPTLAADGDTGDDGVAFALIRAGQLDAFTIVSVTGTMATSYLDAWIDFNGDGSFNSIGERVATKFAVHDGRNELHFAVPSDATAGSTYARFRISTAGVAGPGGAATDGEVEDYVVTIAPPRSSAGELGPAVRLNTPEVHRPAAMLVEDADGDGDLDIYTASGDSSQPQNPTYEPIFGIYLHENFGGGQFETRLVTPTRAEWAFGLLHRDFTGDGRLDFVVASGWPDTLDLFEQAADGTYFRHPTAVSGPVTVVEAGDLDDDGDLDVMAADVFNERISWYENNGTGGFIERVLDEDALNIEHALLTDMDSDGDLDIAYLGYFATVPFEPMELAWLRNDSGGAFVRLTQSLAGLQYMKLTAVGDFDSDGDVDLFASGIDSAWLENDGAEMFTWHTINAAPAYQLHGAAVDINADGNLDVVAASYGAVPAAGAVVVIYLGDGAGQFVREDVDIEVGAPLALKVVDMDADGRLDVVVADADLDVISFYRQTAVGTFQEQVLLTSLSGAFQAIDLDLDGDLDFVIGVLRPSYHTFALWWYEQTAPGKFVIRPLIKEQLGFGVTVLDLDRDGDLDLLDNTLSWFENDGAQQFTRRTLYGGIDRLNTYAPTDYDGDGDIDLVIGNGTSGVTFSSVRLLENNGNQQFTLRQLTTTNHSANHVAPADLDGDGDIDVFVGGSNREAISWFEQVAGGGLVRHVIDTTSMFIDAIGVADLDADGDIDLIADSLYYRNDGSGNFAKFVLKATEPKLLGHRFADLDGDGLLDIVASVITRINDQPLYENSFVAYRNLGVSGFAPVDLQTGLRQSTQSELADIDGDGDLDGIFVDIFLGEFWYQENLSSVSLVLGSATVVEELGPDAVVTFHRSGDSAGELAVEVALAGTASYGDDYTITGAAVQGATATVLFPAGVDEVQVALHAVDDQLIEPDEVIELQLMTPAGYFLTGSGAATVMLKSLDYRGDYGDAPATYGTTILADGARHLAVGPRLGSLRTEEINGTPTIFATGDAGDDGVATIALRAGDLASSWQVLVSGAPMGALLDAWIDFNGDGVWDEATERVACRVSVANGFNTLGFATPSTAVAGTTFARIRVSTAGTLTAHGPANDGEVEDYTVTIAPPRIASGEFALPTTLSTVLTNPAAVEPLDYDRDGDVDLIVANPSNSRIYWVENRGSTAPVTTELLATSTPQRVLVADMDADGLDDLVTAGGTGAGTIQWHRRASDGTYATHLVQTISSVADLVVNDLDGDGDLDILAATGQAVRWYVNDGNEGFTFVDIQTAATSFEAIDLSGDGRLDLVATTSAEIVLLTQSPAGTFALTSLGAFTGAIDVATADFDSDGDRDVWAASSTTAVILERQDATYTAHTLAIGPWGRQNTLADIDGDGDVDLVSKRPAAVASGGVAWYENQGEFSFTAHRLRGISGTPVAATVADFDGNGQLDLVLGTTSPASIVVMLAVPAVSVLAATSTFGETGATSLDLHFIRRDDLSVPFTVTLTISGLVAFGADYAVTGAAVWSNTAAQVTFPIGVDEVIVTLTAINDIQVELDESLIVTIGEVSGQMPLAPASVSLTLVSDEFGGNFGDAPAPYPSTLAAHGAAHEPLGPHLGPTRGFAAEATPALLGNADPDDDGVTWDTLQVGSADAAVVVDVRNAPAGAIVDVWLDVDRDGTWYSAAEHVVAAEVVAEGVQRLAFEVPAWASAGPTFARVRISTAGNVSANGVAADGEVEDYAVTIEPPTATTPVYGLASTIVAVATRGNVTSLVPVDFDRDGDIDLAANGVGSSLAWYENQGAAGFVPRGIDPQASSSIGQIATVDYDRDGDLDLVALVSSSLVWFENFGGNTFVRHTLYSKSAIGRFVIGEFDRTGQPQVVASLSSGGNIANLALLAPDGGGGLVPVAIGSIAATNAANTRFVPVDFDRDGDLDVVVAWGPSQVVSNIVLLANDGQGAFTSVPLGATTNGRVVELLTSDIDRDGDPDLMTTLSGATEMTRLTWWERQAGGTLTPHVIVSPQPLGTPTLIDVNGDGVLDVVATRTSTVASPPLPNYSQFLFWLGGPGGAFTFQIDPALPPVRSGSIVAASDLDQDGDLDLVSVNSSGFIAWYRSVPAVQGDYNRDGVVDSADYGAWRAQFGAITGTGLQADGNGDGVVDAADYVLWKKHLGAPNEAQGTATELIGSRSALNVAASNTVRNAGYQESVIIALAPVDGMSAEIGSPDGTVTSIDDLQSRQSKKIDPKSHTEGVVAGGIGTSLVLDARTAYWGTFEWKSESTGVRSVAHPAPAASLLYQTTAEDLLLALAEEQTDMESELRYDSDLDRCVGGRRERATEAVDLALLKLGDDHRLKRPLK
jgi:hypothetical protein